MFDRKKLEQDVEIGNKASEIYQTEIVQNFFREIRLRTIDSWEKSHDTDLEGREKAYLFLKLVRGFENTFKTAMDTGKISSETLDKLREGAFENL
jgi:hypothetical protein